MFCQRFFLFMKCIWLRPIRLMTYHHHRHQQPIHHRRRRRRHLVWWSEKEKIKRFKTMRKKHEIEKLHSVLWWSFGVRHHHHRVRLSIHRLRVRHLHCYGAKQPVKRIKTILFAFEKRKARSQKFNLIEQRENIDQKKANEDSMFSPRLPIAVCFH